MAEFQNKEVYLLYGSQTGNAESIAEEVSAKFAEEGVPNKCMTLSGAKKQPMKDLASAMLIICSTTGNGDAPENADSWWRSIKLRSAAKDMFQDVPFCVLGLGDTNYDKFCHMGKVIDKRMEELGGKRILDLHCADEGTGELEVTVEAWKEAVTVAVKKTLTEAEASNQRSVEEEKEEKMGDGSGEEEKETRTEEAETDTEMLALDSDPLSASDDQLVFMSTVPELLPLHRVMEDLAISHDAVAEAPTTAQIPKAKPALESSASWKFGCGERVRDSGSEGVGEQKEERPDGGWNASLPFEAKVLGGRWLTANSAANTAAEYAGTAPWGSTRNVIHMELSLEGSGIDYSPGDSIGLCCPNPPYAVDVALSRLRAAHPEVDISRDAGVVSKCGRLSTSLGELLAFKLDLCGVPKKAALVTLSQACTDPAEKRLMLHLASKGDVGKKLWVGFVEEQRLGLADLLHLFPSCTPKLHQLLVCTTALPPRYYSIASSPMVSPDRVAVAFSVVRYTAKEDAGGEVAGGGVRRIGLCTAYLQHLLQTHLSGASSHAHTGVRMFHKPSICFHLPGSVAPPLILIGPGTGVAPFIGFLEHRHRLEQERQRAGSNEDCCTGMWRGGFEMEEEDLPAETAGVAKYIHSVQPGSVSLFFGCRNEDDFLYREQLQTLREGRTLTNLQVAHSRAQEQKVYVTHKIRERGAEVARLILQEGAHVYICGDGNRMAKDVNLALREVLGRFGQLDAEEVDAVIEQMKLRRRYVLDIW
eukprot:CAMPEP_0173173904 /NCGR_PEP_ID=MMETSP1141-20130122/3074_1 /TAXON_ID=483371 /ORGANISM="non described non described, Strain CCMP2298" /LENGTH=757 /DNA_ID=CAMNT_0014096005 /DNA_START=86 /DNA_END=2357 /DNA_ORIENTATION=+